jgi:hypothetical protein
MHAADGFRDRHKAAVKDAFQRQEVKDRLKVGQLESWAKNKAERCDLVFTPETRQKMSEAAKARWSDPIKGERARQSASSPARRRQLSDSAYKRATPEYRAMMAEKTRLSWEKRRQSKG